jgi:hypothetical protein
MEQDFDTAAAVDEIGSGLGLGSVTEVNDDVDLDVQVLEKTPDTSIQSNPPVNKDGTLTAPTEGVETPATTPPATTDIAPKTWRPEAAAEWANLPPTIKAEIQKREEDIFRGLETYRADADTGRRFTQTLQPFMATLNQYGIDPQQQISSLMQAHHTLALGSPQQKMDLFAQLARDYNIDTTMLPLAPYVDPAVQGLQQTVQNLESRLSMADRQAQQARQADAQQAVNRFASDPANAYFEELSNDIAGLLQSGVAKDLKDAYERAVWANPVTRGKEQSRIAAETASKAAEEAKARAAKAKSALAATVRTSAKSGSAAAPIGSIDDTLEATLAGIRNRG